MPLRFELVKQKLSGFKKVNTPQVKSQKCQQAEDYACIADCELPDWRKYKQKCWQKRSDNRKDAQPSLLPLLKNYSEA